MRGHSDSVVMELESRYSHIIAELKLGHRALTRLSDDELQEILRTLGDGLTHKDFLHMEKALCVLEHSASLYPSAENVLVSYLNSDLPDSILIFALNASRRHVIQGLFQRGQRLRFEYLEALKKLLHSRSPEVVEWTLRTIEECGNQGVYFLREFDKIKPAPWKWFNPHQRAVRELIEMLERRWSRFETPKSEP
jgi:hypothetical protein